MDQNSQKKARLISIEGIEGVGKSTVIAAIRQTLQNKGCSLLLTREPGGTPVAEAIRALLLADHAEQITSMAELLLIFAARSQHIEHQIKPALARGEWVVTDRFTDASFAYQGAGRGIPVEHVQLLSNWVQGSCVPDVTVLLDAPVEIGLQRMATRGAKDRIEKEGIEFFERIRQAYLERAQKEPERFCVIDANQEEVSVIADVLAALAMRWKNWL
jgi:dTMP kinase